LVYFLTKKSVLISKKIAEISISDLKTKRVDSLVDRQNESDHKNIFDPVDNDQKRDPHFMSSFLAVFLFPLSKAVFIQLSNR